MLKRCLVFIMVAVLAVSCCLFTGCENKKDDASEGDVATLAPTPSPAPTKDPSKVDFSMKNFDANTIFDNVKVQGRTCLYEKGIALDYTASAVEFNVCCEGDVTAKFYANPTVIDNNRKPVLFINVYVDGVLQGTRDQYLLKMGETEITLATGLSKGTHNILVERQNEAENGDLYLTGLSFGGEFDVKPMNSNLFIEVIGDSITTGYGNLYPNNTGGAKDPYKNPRSTYYQDGTRAYACLAMKELGADYSIVAQQGIGASVGWQAHTMLATYEMTCYQRGRKTDWGFERKADIVVINLGTNDISCGKADNAKLQKGFEDMIDLVRKHNPEAKIVWAYGAMDVAAIPLIEAAATAKGGEQAGIYTCTNFVQNGAGGIGHPVVSAHETNAEILASKIKEILGMK